MIFAGILAADARPWPVTGLTTARWIAEVPTLPVELRRLWLTQERLDIGVLLGARGESRDPFPHVVRWRGVLYLEDGHHRVVRLALRGVRRARCRVLTLTKI